MQQAKKTQLHPRWGPRNPSKSIENWAQGPPNWAKMPPNPLWGPHLSEEGTWERLPPPKKTPQEASKASKPLPEPPPKPIKIEEKLIPKGTLFWTSNFDRFLLQLGAPEPPKSLKLYWFYKHFLLWAIFKIRSTFESILVPTCLHFPFKNPQINHQISVFNNQKIT